MSTCSILRIQFADDVYFHGFIWCALLNPWMLFKCIRCISAVGERRNSSALAMELRLSCTNPSICVWYMTFVSHIHMGASHTVAKWLEQPFDITQILRSSLCDGNIRMRKISRVIQNNTYVKRPCQHFDSYSHHHHWQQYSIIMYHVLYHCLSLLPK